MKRIKIIPKKPNPLFELWINQWMEEAALKNSNLQSNFSKALNSLRKYPLPLKSGKECIILQHFGVKLCSMLDKKLEEYEADLKTLSNGIDADSSMNSQSSVQCQAKNDLHTSPKQKQDNISSTSELSLLPWNICSYIILLNIYKKTREPRCTGDVLERDVMREVKQIYETSGNILRKDRTNLDFCDDKLSISTLISNGLVFVTGDPTRCGLTQNGISFVTKLFDIANINVHSTSFDMSESITTLLNLMHEQKFVSLMKNVIHAIGVNENQDKLKLPFTTNQDDSDGIAENHFNIPKVIKHISESSQCKKTFVRNVTERKRKQGTKSNENLKKGLLKGTSNVAEDFSKKVDEEICFTSNTFDIVLLVDKQETCGSKVKAQHDATIMELTQLNVVFEVRHLKVGDFAWVARCRQTNKELVLPYIIERKRIDDLSASITDGRFHEQKFRLKQCGIKNILYIIENYDKCQRFAVPISWLMQASVNSLVQDKFMVKYTNSHKHSMSYLACLTKILHQVYKEKTLVACSKENLSTTDTSCNSIKLMKFEEFNKAASKQRNFKVSQMFIRQLLQLKGISVDKALAITRHYPTPQALITALRNSDGNGQQLLANIRCEHRKQQLNLAISKSVYELYTKKTLS